MTTVSNLEPPFWDRIMPQLLASLGISLVYKETRDGVCAFTPSMAKLTHKEAAIGTSNPISTWLF